MFYDYYGYSLLYVLFSWLLWPIAIIALIIFFIRRSRRNHLQAENRFMRIAFSREDALSQVYFLLAIAFTGVTLLALNRQLADPLSGLTILFLTSALGIVVGFYYKALYTLAFSVLAIISWWVGQAGEWVSNYSTKGSPVLSGLVLLTLLMYVLGHFLQKDPKWKRFSMIFVIFSLLFMSGILFFLSSQSGLQSFSQLLTGGTILASWQIMLSLVAFIVGLGVLYFMTFQRKLILTPETLAGALFTLFALVILLLPERSLYVNVSGNNFFYYGNSQELSPIGIFWAVVFNIGVFLEMLGIILVGYMRKESWHVNLGVVLLFILILVKYFDWFFTFLDKSLFFIGAGILMFVVGWLMERARKRVLASMNDNKPTIPHA